MNNREQNPDGAQYHCLEAVLSRDKLVVWIALSLVAALAWSVLVALYLQMGDMPATMGTTRFKPLSACDFALMIAMWAIMMIGMSLPSADPMILLYAGATRQQHSSNRLSPVSAFSLGSIAVWTLFSAATTWLLERETPLSRMTVSNSRQLSGTLLIVADLYQLSPLKQACLRQGTAGAFGMGLRHGAYCLGYCWSLMLLLFLAGVMSLLWIALLNLFVLTKNSSTSKFYRVAAAPWH